jgi:hypothetical protein
VGAFGRFFRQFFLLVTVQQMTGGLFRFIGGMCRSMIKAHSVGFVTILLFFMLGGFIIPRPHIRVWWVWFYWISPLTYANQALSVNELLAPRWNKVGFFLFTLQNAGNIGIDGWIFCVMIILMYLLATPFVFAVFVCFVSEGFFASPFFTFFLLLCITTLFSRGFSIFACPPS